MGRHEFPPFRMLVQGGRLVPATPADAERLDTWRNGSAVNVTFVRNGGRVMERKWWAILNRAVKECKTPWKTSAEASEAIKLAIGIVNLTKTVGGDFLAYPKSLTELADPELDDAVRDMIDVVYHVTGVDPEEWRKHVANIREENSESPAPSADDGRAGTPSQPEPDAATPEETGDIEAQADPDASPVSDGPNEPDRVRIALKRECMDKFMQIATNPALDVAGRRDVLEQSKEPWKRELPDDLDFVRACLQTADKVAKGELGADAARTYLEGLV